MNSLINNLGQQYGFNTEEVFLINQLFIKRDFNKGQKILLANIDENDELHFVDRGCLRIYSTDEHGEEHNLQFAPENHWITDIYSFWTDNLSIFTLDALEKTQTYSIKRAALEQLFDKIPPVERHFRILVQNAYVAYLDRVNSYLSRPAQERYQMFIHKYPQLINRLPQYHIASYIGVKPQSLSRLRSRF